ncbi:hypothetical protein MMPV_006775 [Pyropia vietnamensis]
MNSGRRPEHVAPPTVYYSTAEASKYAASSRNATVQAAITRRCLELLALPPSPAPRLLLDVGSGTGMSSAVLSAEGHHVVAYDISPPMLAEASPVHADRLIADAGEGGFACRPGVLDGAVSVSAIQWLCVATSSAEVPRRRMKAFFSALYNSLRRGARAALQFYPDSAAQVQVLAAAAAAAGFSGGVLVDYPHSAKAKKYFLVLTAGVGGRTAVGAAAMPAARGVEDGAGAASSHEGRRMGRGRGKRARGRTAAAGGGVTRRERVLAKKDRMRRQGRETRVDSKYTGRKRSGRF